MKKSVVNSIVEKYLQIFPNEKDRLSALEKFLVDTSDSAICDWNNACGHITAGGFVFCQTTKRFLVMWHKDLAMYLYPGGHCEPNDHSPLERAKSEVQEETGLKVTNLKVFEDELIPLDIDTHTIPFNKRVNMPEHLHFDFRYVFVTLDESGVAIDEEEMANYKWIDEAALSSDPNYGSIINKLKNILM